MKKITIAIDGYSSCGKSTMAKDLAKEIGYIYIDSGAMYRAVTLYCLENGLFTSEGILTDALEKAMPNIRISFQLDPDTQRPITFLNGQLVEDKIRSMEVSSHVSPVAALGFVREAMVRIQQEMGKAKGIVMDGRDIGTVVLPFADVKIFLTASAEERARRRLLELVEKGTKVTYEEVLEDMKVRDYNDSHRATAPLKPAEDSKIVNTDGINLEQSVALLKEIILTSLKG